MGTHTTLDSMREAGSILAGIRCADDLTIAASRDGGNRAVRLLAQAALDPTDQLTAIAAVHSLSQVFDESADDVLVALLDHDAAYLREHAAWAFGTRLPRFDAIAGLLQMVIVGGFSGMIAQRTLQQWAASAPEHVALATEGALLGVVEPEVRAPGRDHRPGRGANLPADAAARRRGYRRGTRTARRRRRRAR